MKKTPHVAQPGEAKQLSFFISPQNAEGMNFLRLDRPEPLVVRLVNDGWASFLTERSPDEELRARLVVDFSGAGPLEFAQEPLPLPGWERVESRRPLVFVYQQTSRYWTWFSGDLIDLRFPGVVATGENGMGTVSVRLENVEGVYTTTLEAALFRLRSIGAPSRVSAAWKYQGALPVSGTLTDDGGGVLKLVISSSASFIRPSGSSGRPPAFFVMLSDGYAPGFRALTPPEQARRIDATIPDDQPWSVTSLGPLAYPVWRLDYDPLKPSSGGDVQLKLSNVQSDEEGYAQVLLYFLDVPGMADSWQVLHVQVVPPELGAPGAAGDVEVAGGSGDGGVQIVAFTVDGATAITLDDLKAPRTVTLSWNVLNAGYVTLTGAGVLNTLSGSRAAQVEQTTVYTLTAFSPSLAAAVSASVTVTVAPDLLTRVIPRGTIVLWSGSLDPAQLPAGWWPCDGTHGTPNLRDRFVMGAGGSAQPGAYGDASTHTHEVAPPSTTYTSTQDGAHSHKMPANWYKRNLSCGRWSGVDVGGSFDPNITRTQTDGAHTHRVTVSIPAFNSGVNDTTVLPPWYALAYLMKLGV